jgi:hypothetical protein
MPISNVVYFAWKARHLLKTKHALDVCKSVEKSKNQPFFFNNAVNFCLYVPVDRSATK